MQRRMNTHSQFDDTSKTALHSWLVTVCASVLLAGLLFSAPASAADAANRQHAIQIALQQNGGDGKVLGVKTVQNKNGQTVFAVKVLSNGRVRVFRIKKAR